jgi:hypothetical protein
MQPGQNGKTMMTLAMSGDTASLSVAGTVKVGRQSPLYVAGGTRPLRIISGSVYWDGNHQGRGEADGYSVNHVQAGLYDIIFTQAFSDLPGASVTQVHPDKGDPFTEENLDKGGDVLDNANIVVVSKYRLRVKTGASNGAVQDRAFSFMVIGPD